MIYSLYLYTNNEKEKLCRSQKKNYDVQRKISSIYLFYSIWIFNHFNIIKWEFDMVQYFPFSHQHYDVIQILIEANQWNHSIYHGQLQ